jgi:predicted membrane chloride channel (bestrophin family)
VIGLLLTFRTDTAYTRYAFRYSDSDFWE